jgi:hypothetical protein
MNSTRPEAPRVVQVAVAVLGAQAVALLVGAGVLITKTVSGRPHSTAGALLGAALALAGAAVLGLCGRGLFRLSPPARSPVVVIELLALPVGFDLAFQADRIAYGAPILIGALVVVYALFTPTARTAFDRNPYGALNRERRSG